MHDMAIWRGVPWRSSMALDREREREREKGRERGEKGKGGREGKRGRGEMKRRSCRRCFLLALASSRGL